ncbi:hypothetical protein H8A99_35180 [Bradyrhizobium sp. Arg68]|uniref:hypothetical protein n=1 Tax=Bradyrhizobium ivorense TaxID=2511166 RepID=UPI001E298E79|nr:hypothetical protein [Bradyrhizobium ivorense]MCC8941545.1 hypothetical protein [Bradyrhizobium ivorense]
MTKAQLGGLLWPADIDEGSILSKVKNRPSSHLNSVVAAQLKASGMTATRYTCAFDFKNWQKMRHLIIGSRNNALLLRYWPQFTRQCCTQLILSLLSMMLLPAWRR